MDLGHRANGSPTPPDVQKRGKKIFSSAQEITARRCPERSAKGGTSAAPGTRYHSGKGSAEDEADARCIHGLPGRCLRAAWDTSSPCMRLCILERKSEAMTPRSRASWNRQLAAPLVPCGYAPVLVLVSFLAIRLAIRHPAAGA